VSDDVATYLNNKKRRELSRLEDENHLSVQIFGLEEVSPEHLVIECLDSQGREVKIPLT
jgi:ribonuclease E